MFPTVKDSTMINSRETLMCFCKRAKYRYLKERHAITHCYCFNLEAIHHFMLRPPSKLPSSTAYQATCQSNFLI